MEINKKYKLEKAVSKDPLRDTLHNIFINKQNAIATDGHILVLVPVKTEKTDTPGLLSPDALKLGRKVMPKGLDEIRIALDGKQVLPDGTALPRPEIEEKPPVENVLRDAQKLKRKIKFGINASLLKDLSEAIGSDELVLEVKAPDKPILVRPLNDEAGEKALIMPVRIREGK